MISVAQSALDRLSWGPATTEELVRALGASRANVRRALQPHEDAGRVVRMGSTKAARYALSRHLGALGSQWPLYCIDQEGSPIQLGAVHALEGIAYYGRAELPRLSGLFGGIPYFLQDSVPAGFLGRAIPSAYPELDLPARVSDWTDLHRLTFLTRRGSETVGDLILGEESLNGYLSGQRGPTLVREQDRPQRYPELANEAMAGAPPGSSAQGEHPKFSIRIEVGGEISHVIVKFSPRRDNALGSRWADLLIAESIASEFLNDIGIPAAISHIHEYGDRVFLESQRFDRVGSIGRRGVVSLQSVDLARYGLLDRWSACAERLRRDRLLPKQDAERLMLLDAFGSLIANTDRHFGNITLYDSREAMFALAPVYDMLPMLFAPSGDQLVEREFSPENVRAQTLAVWPRARELAIEYWTRVATDSRLTEDFQMRARECRRAVTALADRGAPRATGST